MDIDVGETIGPALVVLFMFGSLIFLAFACFAGDPDLIDAIIFWLMK